MSGGVGGQPQHMRGTRRSGTFAYSDIRSAAKDFVSVVAEFSDPMWEHDDVDELATALTEKALKVLHDPEAMW